MENTRMEPPGTTLLTYEHSGGWVDTTAWSPDGMRVASGGPDATVRIWDASTGKIQYTLRGHSDIVKAVAWSPDGHLLASAGSDTTARVWEISTGTPLLTYRGHYTPVVDVAWSPDGTRIASVSTEVHIWQVR